MSVQPIPEGIEKTSLSHIELIPVRFTGKTLVWGIYTKDNAIKLGEIRWFGAWRKYSFFPEAETVYEQVCLREIAGFIEEQTKAHRKAKA